MASATIDGDGQVTLPADMRERLKVRAGDRLDFVEVAPGIFQVFLANRSIRELRGLPGQSKRTVSIDEMHDVVVRRASAQPRSAE